MCSGSLPGMGAAPWASLQLHQSHTEDSCIQYALFGFAASILGLCSLYHGRVVQWILKQFFAFFHLDKLQVCEIGFQDL